MTFLNIIGHYYNWYENEKEEGLSSEERMAVEEFAEWLDEETDSEFSMNLDLDG